MAVNPGGNTKLLGIVGHPIAQVKGPTTWSLLFEEYGVDAVGLPMHVHPDDLKAFVDGMHGLQNLIGLIITIPHKPVALQLCTGASERARTVGSVNVMRRLPEGGWFGDILDGEGFVSGLRARGRSLEGRRTLLVGTGGVGQAIAASLAQAGASEIVVSDLLTERAERVSAAIRGLGTSSTVGPPRAGGFDLVINATPVGMRPGDGVSIDLDGVAESAIVADVVVLPEMTPLLLDAQARGCFVQPGRFMMNYQVGSIADFMSLREPGDDRFSAAAIEKLAGHH